MGEEDGKRGLGEGAADDAPKAKPVAGEEPKTEDFGVCQLEPKGLDGGAVSLLIAGAEADELPPKLNTPEVPLVKELVVLATEAEFEALAPKLKTGGAASPLDVTAVVEKVVVVLVAEAETEELEPKPKTGGAVPPVGATAFVEDEDEPRPKLNTLRVAILVELAELPSETAVGFTPNILDVAPVPDEEAEELKPKGVTGLKS